MNKKSEGREGVRELTFLSLIINWMTESLTMMRIKDKAERGVIEVKGEDRNTLSRLLSGDAQQSVKHIDMKFRAKISTNNKGWSQRTGCDEEKRELEWKPWFCGGAF